VQGRECAKVGKGKKGEKGRKGGRGMKEKGRWEGRREREMELAIPNYQSQFASGAAGLI